MARLSKEEWAAARQKWEADPRPGFDWLAAELGVSRQSVSEMAHRKGWAKGGENPAQETRKNPAQEKKNPAQEKPVSNVVVLKPAADKGTGKGGKSGGKGGKPKVLPGSTEGRIERPEWMLEERRGRGRPTEYREEFCDMMIAFFDIEVQEVKTIPLEDGTSTVSVVQNTFPTLTRFASKLGVSRQTLHDWATKKDESGAPVYPEFADAYARARDLQEALITEGGMAGSYEPRFATFAAKNLIGWKDQVETKIETTISAISKEELDALYAARMEESERQRQLLLERRKGRGE